MDIEEAKENIEISIITRIKNDCVIVNKQEIETVLAELDKNKRLFSIQEKRKLQLLRRKDRELDKKDKIIDLMAEELRYQNGMQQDYMFCIDMCDGKSCDKEKCKERIKQYFKKKVEERSC